MLYLHLAIALCICWSMVPSIHISSYLSRVWSLVEPSISPAKSMIFKGQPHNLTSTIWPSKQSKACQKTKLREPKPRSSSALVVPTRPHNNGPRTQECMHWHLIFSIIFQTSTEQCLPEVCQCPRHGHAPRVLFKWIGRPGIHSQVIN